MAGSIDARNATRRGERQSLACVRSRLWWQHFRLEMAEQHGTNRKVSQVCWRSLERRPHCFITAIIVGIRIAFAVTSCCLLGECRQRSDRDQCLAAGCSPMNTAMSLSTCEAASYHSLSGIVGMPIMDLLTNSFCTWCRRCRYCPRPSHHGRHVAGICSRHDSGTGIIGLRLPVLYDNTTVKCPGIGAFLHPSMLLRVAACHRSAGVYNILLFFRLRRRPTSSTVHYVRQRCRESCLYPWSCATGPRR